MNNSPNTTQRSRRPNYREVLEIAITELEGSNGFQSWLRARAAFHNYSLCNQILIASQKPDATKVMGYRQWVRNFDRHVLKGEKGISILIPMVVRKKDDQGNPTDDKECVGFKVGKVFDVSQTEGEPVPVLPISDITGDSHIHYISQLEELAQSINYKVSYEDLEDAGGYCDYSNKEIVIRAGQEPNAVVRVLIHELVHAHGTSYKEYGRKAAEAITESATWIVCQQLGLETGMSSIPYVATWADSSIRTAVAADIDYFAAVIEFALGIRDKEPVTPKREE